MKITTKSIYAIRALHTINLETKKGEIPVGISIISGKLDISNKYLEQIFSELKKAKLVISTAGKNGGYQLAKDSDKITILDVINVMDGGVIPIHCVNNRDCDVCSLCSINGLWMEMKNHMEQYLSSVSIDSLDNIKYPVLGCPDNIFRDNKHKNK